MASQHLLTTSPIFTAIPYPSFGGTWVSAEALVHLSGMDTIDRTNPVDHDSLDRVLSLSELAVTLRVSVQTIYDLRSQGRGPRGFRIGRELRFRASEIDAWLARMEDADAERHPLGGR